MESPEVFADEGITGICAGGDGGEGEARVERRGEILERVDGDVDAAVEESVFNLLAEDALGVERRAVREGCGGDKVGVLHAIAGGADDLSNDGVTVMAELGGNVIGLPKRKLRAAGAETNGLGAHR